VCGDHSKSIRYAVVGLVAPDPGRGGDHRIATGHYPGVVTLPPAVMHEHLVADRDIGHALPTA
jgi:hypothetical protein